MSTNGTIGIKLGGKTIRTYNHSDSYPSWLGMRVAEFVRETDATVVKAQIANLRFVAEDSAPTAEELALFQNAGIHQNVSAGTDWYATLRGLQGNLAGYLVLGIWPNWSWGDNQEWGYIVDYDDLSIQITRGGQHFRRVRFEDLIPMTDFQVEALFAQIEQDAYK